MKKIVATGIALAAIVSLAGCISGPMQKGTDSLLGHNIQFAIDKLGFPSGQREIAGGTVYVWAANRGSVATVMPTGNGGGFGMAAQYYCIIQLGTDSNGTITRTQWEGNLAGCAHYANALQR